MTPKCLLRSALCLLLTAGGCADHRPRVPNADVQADLPRTHEQLGGGLPLFAATVVEGGGLKGTNTKPAQVVVDITREFDKQYHPPGRIAPGRHDTNWRVLSANRADENREFETPMNGTRILAFGQPESGRLVVYANLVFADTERNRGNAALGRSPHQDPWWLGPLLVATVGVAFVAIFLPWLGVKAGAIALGVAIALFAGYEAAIPGHVNIRVDLLLLLPVLLSAVVSLAIAAITRKKK